jgi:hypothetical protein
MIVLAYHGSRCTKFHAAGWTCGLLRPFIWSRVSGLMRLRDGSDKGTASNFVKISEMRDGDPGNDQTSDRSRKHEPSKFIGTER